MFLDLFNYNYIYRHVSIEQPSLELLTCEHFLINDLTFLLDNYNWLHHFADQSAHSTTADYLLEKQNATHLSTQRATQSRHASAFYSAW